MQRRIMADEALAPGTVKNHIGVALRLGLVVRADHFRAAVRQLVETCPALRTVIVTHDGEPRSVVRTLDDASVDIVVADGSEWTDSELDQWLGERHLAPFDLETGPPIRFGLVRRSEGQSVVSLVAHHATSDLWSLVVLGDRLGDLLQDDTDAPLDRRPPGPTPDDLAQAERDLIAGSFGAEALRFWSPVFESWTPQQLDIVDAVGEGSGHAATIAVDLDAELEAGIRRIARERGVSARSAVLGALQVVLQRGYGLDRVVIGELKARRTARSARTIGCLVDFAVRSADVTESATLSDHLVSVHQEERAAKHFAKAPFGWLLESLRPGHGDQPFFAMAFSWQKSSRLVDPHITTSIALGRPGEERVVRGISVTPLITSTRTAAMPLSLLGAEDRGSVQLAIEYDVDRVDREEVLLLARRLRQVLRQTVEQPDAPIDGLEVIDELERQARRDEWQGVASELDSSTSVLDLFDANVGRRRSEPAVSDARSTLTYGELDARSRALAGAMVDAGVHEGDLIGLCVQRSVDMVVAVLAIWRCGAGYVPMDPGFPPDRLQVMAADAAIRAMVIDAETEAQLRQAPGALPWLDQIPAIDIASLHDQLDVEAAATPRVTGRHVAYVIFTSGSTGRPKGVVVEHRSVVNFLRSMAHRPGLREIDVVLAATTLSFDISVLELLLPLATGAHALVIARDEAVDPDRLAAALERVTVAQGTPTMWKMLVDTGWPGRRGLTILCGGELLSRNLADELLGRCDTLWNMYGPTETTVWSAVERVHADDGAVSLGRPIDNTRLYVVEGGSLVPDGCRGELWIGGAGVARGYIGRDDLTAERFVPDPFTQGDERVYRTGDLVRRTARGDLVFLGRVDAQVKMRGHRIELEEIESILRRHPDVKDAVVALCDLDDDDQRLVGFVRVVGGDVDALERQLRRHCSASLPDYMVPSGFAIVDEFPLTPNNKIDRRSLAARQVRHFRSKTNALSAADQRSQLLDEIVQVFRAVLGNDTIGPADDFFELGGNSLLATRIASRLRRLPGVQISVRSIFDRPVPADLAVAIAAAEAGPADPGSAPFAPSFEDDDESGALTFSQERMWFLHRVDPTSAAYNLAIGVAVRGPLEIDELAASMQRIAERHVGLRTAFVEREGSPRAIVRELPPIQIDVVDVRGVDGAEREAVVADGLTDLSSRSFDLTRPPLFRLRAFRLASDEWVVGMVLHHIIADQWSFGILAEELAAEYGRTSSLGKTRSASSTPEITPDLYARLHRSSVTGRHLDALTAYWSRQLAGLPEIDLPTDRPRPARGVLADAESIVVDIPEALGVEVQRLAGRVGVSEFMVLLAAFGLVVRDIAGADDIPIGVPIANRNRLESERLITSLVNTLVVRLDLAGDPDPGEVLSRVREVVLDAFAHQDMPFELLVRELAPRRETSRSPLFQTLFNVQNAPIELPEIEGLEFRAVPIRRAAAQFELSFSVDPHLSRTITLDYAASLFDADRMHDLVDRYLATLDALVAELPDARLTGRGPRPSARFAPPHTSLGRNDATTRPGRDEPRTELERGLATIWERALGVTGIGRDDDFFELGGHSLLAVRVLADVERLTGRRPPISTLFQTPSLADFASSLESDGWLTPWTSLVPVRTRGDRLPFFYVTPFMISSLSLHELATRLDDDIPFYAIDPQGLESDDPIHESVEEMASHYVAEMKTVQPFGPYTVGGHCAGGVVALEITRQLEAAGDEVDRLVVVDVAPPGMAAPRVDWSRYVVDRVRLYGRPKRLFGAVRWQLGTGVQRFRNARRAPNERERSHEVRRLHARAHRSYSGGPIAAHLALVRSSEWARLADKAWHLEWQRYSPSTTIHEVHGAHSELLSGERASELAAVLRKILEQP